MFTTDENTSVFDLEKTEGLVYNIQHYSIHDGPGERTTIFLKGCPLKCLWCQNPESQSFAPELFFDREKCTGCGRCIAACPQGAIRLIDGLAIPDRSRCTGCGKCSEVCLNEARNLQGKKYRAGDLVDYVMKEELFFRISGGGVTLSGGEALAQPTFTYALMRLFKAAGQHTTLDTSGFCRWEELEKILKYTDLVLLDLKHPVSGKHKQYAGVPNEVILENAVRMDRAGVRMWARIPIVPGYNDSEEDINAVGAFIKEELPRVEQLNILAYHKFGAEKYLRLGKAYAIPEVESPTEARMQELRTRMEQMLGIPVHIGG